MRLSVASSLCAVWIAACSSSHAPDGGDAAPDARSDARWDECTVPSECVVVPASCCGSCGAATRGDATALNRAHLGAHRSSVCTDGFGCPACFSEPDPTLLATCEANRCIVVDLQTHAATECTTPADCRVRAVECCECGASITPSTVVAISSASALEDLVCDPGTGCPECLPDYPSTFGATCDDGRCVAVFAGAP
ncbi:MAG: hypothetical protein M3Y87_02580 [Myxococcota bacterium]|nr:hypothetical protein [Myxococcota bacterium]